VGDTKNGLAIETRKAKPCNYAFTFKIVRKDRCDLRDSGFGHIGEAEQSNIECIMFADDLSGNNKVSPQNMIAALKREWRCKQKDCRFPDRIGQKD